MGILIIQLKLRMNMVMNQMSCKLLGKRVREKTLCFSAMLLRAYVRTNPRSKGSYFDDLIKSNQNSVHSVVGSAADIETQRNAPNYHWMTSDKKIGLLPTSSSLTRISSANETLRKSGGRTVFGNPGRKFDLNSSACQTNFASSSFYDRCDNEDATMRKESVLYHGEGSRDESLNNENCINDKNLTLETSTKAHKVTLDSPGSKSRKRSAAIGEKERARKASITKKLESLQHLLPKSGEDNKEVVLDDVIDYVKYLRQQVKPLNHSRLGGEATNDPFIYLEEFGHFLVDQPTLNEPLEEILGQMVEMDMSAVTNMLEAKGLYVMPTSLAEGAINLWMHVYKKEFNVMGVYLTDAGED